MLGMFDLEYFLATYFPKIFKAAFGKHHKQYIAGVQNIVLHDGKQAIGMPRGSGKSSVEKGTFPWAFGYGHRRSGVIVTATVDDAREFIADIKTMLTSKHFGEDFPEIAYPLQRLEGTAHLARGQTYLGKPTEIQWESLRLKLPTIPGSAAGGAVVRAAGIQGKIRGKSSAKSGDVEIMRPDLVVLDDLQTRADAINPNRVEKIKAIVAADVQGLAEDGADLAMIMSCTVIAPGDAADQYLDRGQNPAWNGLRFSMIEKFPDRMDIWEGEYARLLRVDAKLATEYYRAHRDEMDAGAVVDWPEKFNARNELSRLQRGMNDMLLTPAAFWAERQNRPLTTIKDGIIVGAAEIRKRLNGLERREVPHDTQHVTAFVDLHDDLLYWMVTAWTKDFTGHVIDYGVWPEQVNWYFNRGDQSVITLNPLTAGEAKQVGKEKARKLRNSAIMAGLETLLQRLLAESYDVQGDEDGNQFEKIGRIFVDAGYVHRVVEYVIRKLGCAAMVKPSLGVPVGAKDTPMEFWRNENDKATVGHHWVEERPNKRTLRHVKMDVNYWKSACHDALSLSAGTRGGITFWGQNPETHRMVSEHLTSEPVQLVEAKHKVHEWGPVMPNRENHYFDCLVGNLVIASTFGIITQDERDALAEFARPAATRVTDL